MKSNKLPAEIVNQNLKESSLAIVDKDYVPALWSTWLQELTLQQRGLPNNPYEKATVVRALCFAIDKIKGVAQMENMDRRRKRTFVKSF